MTTQLAAKLTQEPDPAENWFDRHVVAVVMGACLSSGGPVIRARSSADANERNPRAASARPLSAAGGTEPRFRD